MKLTPTQMKYGLIIAVALLGFLAYRNYNLMAELEAFETPA
jgi:uncharacterized membrane protein YebE (DUF533 family)